MILLKKNSERSILQSKNLKRYGEEERWKSANEAKTEKTEKRTKVLKQNESWMRFKGRQSVCIIYIEKKMQNVRVGLRADPCVVDR